MERPSQPASGRSRSWAPPIPEPSTPRSFSGGRFCRACQTSSSPRSPKRSGARRRLRRTYGVGSGRRICRRGRRWRSWLVIRVWEVRACYRGTVTAATSLDTSTCRLASSTIRLPAHRAEPCGTFPWMTTIRFRGPKATPRTFLLLAAQTPPTRSYSRGGVALQDDPVDFVSTHFVAVNTAQLFPAESTAMSIGSAVVPRGLADLGR